MRSSTTTCSLVEQGEVQRGQQRGQRAQSLEAVPRSVRRGDEENVWEPSIVQSQRCHGGHWNQSLLRMRTAILQVLVALIVSLIVLTLCRFVVCFSESYSLVANERRSDDALLELCSNGAAVESSRMRQTCMEAKTAHASPLIIKAIVRTGSALLEEASMVVMAPVRAMSVASILTVLGVLPWFGSLRSFFASRSVEHDDSSVGHQTILVMPNGRGESVVGGKARLRSISVASGGVRTPPAFDEDRFDEIDLCDQGFEPLPPPKMEWSRKLLGRVYPHPKSHVD